jgi:thiol-disulfide isomerase/thioredoxin
MSADNRLIFMRSLRKKIVLILILSLIGLIISGCTKTTPPSEVKSGDYPPAPPDLMNATLTKLDGSTFKLADYKGKVLIVNVWATWCGPCRQEIPEFIELQTDLKDKGLEIIGLNLDEMEGAELIKEFGKEMGVNYELVRGDSKLFREFYKVSNRDAIPQSFLIDREGRLLGVFVGGGGKTLQKLLDSAHKAV